jgi:HEAT repeat protein
MPQSLPRWTRWLPFRFRLQTMFLLTAILAVCFAWQRDRRDLVSQLDLRQRQVHQLQTELEERRQSKVSYGRYLTTPEALVAFLQTASEAEFKKRDWNAFAISDDADDSVGPLIGLLASRREVTRRHAAWLLGQIGRKRKPPFIDPVPALVQSLDDGSSAVRAEVMYALGGHGRLARQALPRLKAMMDSATADDVLWSTRAVKEIDPDTNIGPRLYKLFVNGDSSIRRSVAPLLADNLPHDEARQILMAHYRDETDSDTREVLAQVMNKIGS